MFICGSGSFGHEDEIENEANNSPCPTPKRSKRSTSFCKILSRDSANKNPFADRGLDKFYALLADLEDKKQKIYTQKGSEDISFVRFVYTNDDSDQVKPIVVKVKEKKPEKNLIELRSFKSTQSDATDPPTTTSDGPKEEPKTDEKKRKRRCLIRCSGSFKLENLRQPQFYLPAMVVMILLFLAVYGRSFAILCTSIGWYLAPTIVGKSPPAAVSSERKAKRKKEYVRKQSERKMVHSAGPSSPKSVINGLNDNNGVQQQQQQQKQYDRKKSW